MPDSTDRGYETMLRGVLTEKLQKKISIIKGYKSSNPQPPFPCNIYEIPGLFMEEQMSNRRSVGKSLISRLSQAHTRLSTASSQPEARVSTNTRTHSTALALSAITPPPSPAELSKSWRSNSDDPQRGVVVPEETSIPSSLSTGKPRCSLQTASVVPETPRPQYSPRLSPVLSPAGFPAKLLEEVEVQSASTADLDEGGTDVVSGAELPTPLTVVLFEHASICPSVDPGSTFHLHFKHSKLTYGYYVDLASTPSSCKGHPFCWYKHECPYGAECVLKAVGVCNFV